MAFKFENLEVWKLALVYLDDVYQSANRLPKEEVYNLRSQWIRAATSIALNIAEGSTGQSDSEQVRFLGYAIRLWMESTACLRIAQRRMYLADEAGKMKVRTEMLIKKTSILSKCGPGKSKRHSNIGWLWSMAHRP